MFVKKLILYAMLHVHEYDKDKFLAWNYTILACPSVFWTVCAVYKRASLCLS